jgi:hypothetical protein
MTNVNELIQSIDNDQMGGSIYSREDVKRILLMVEVKQTSSIDVDYIVQDLKNVLDTIEDMEADEDSAKFSLTRNEIYLDSCEVNNTQAIDEVKDIISKLYDGVYNKRTQFTVPAND